MSNPVPTPPPADADNVIRVAISDSFQTWMSQCGGSIAVTTYQAGKVAMLGWDEREYEDVDSTEFYAGLRFMLARTDVRPYLAAKVRYGLGLEFPSTALTSDFESDEFWGVGAGGGLMAFATDNLFFDLNLSYEDVFEDIDAEGVDVDLDGWVGTVGVGFAF